jgi:transcriptional regulator with XRE-family HTH domain
MARNVTEEGPNELDVTVGKRVRSARKDKGWSQDNLARAVGITSQQVQKYERGANRISASRLIELCDALEIDVQDVVGGLQKTKPKRQSVIDLTHHEKRALKALRAIPTSKGVIAALHVLETLAPA